MTKIMIDRDLLERLLYSNSPARFDATEYSAARAELFAILANTSQQGEEVVGWRRLDRPYELTAYPSVCAIWHGNGWPVQELYTHPAASVPAGCKAVPVELPPFAQKVISKLQRFEECASDSDAGGVDIGRHWLDLLTQLGLLNRVQRSPGLWEISQQGEDLLASAEGVKDENI